MSVMSGWEAFQAEKRPCRDVYGGECSKLVGPPKWAHKSHSTGDGKHPTLEQALIAAGSSTTPPGALRVLGEYDEELHSEIRNVARRNPNYPHSA